MRVVGLTGGIGSGKSTVAEMFNNLGIPIYIADLQAREIMESDAKVRTEIIEVLGKQAYMGKMPNRKWIGSVVFKDRELLEQLNEIVHPAVGRDFKSWCQSQSDSIPWVIKEAAILFETNGHLSCDATILVTAPKEVRIQRVMHRDQTTREAVLQRMGMQWEDARKAMLATYVLHNKDKGETKLQVQKIYNDLLSRKDT